MSKTQARQCVTAALSSANKVENSLSEEIRRAFLLNLATAKGSNHRLPIRWGSLRSLPRAGQCIALIGNPS